MTNKYGTGLCRICGRPTALLKDGRVGRHGLRKANVWPPQNCSGWSQMPTEGAS